MNLRIEKWNCLFAVLVLFFLGTLFLHSMKCFIDQSAVHAASQKKFSEPEPIDPQIVLPSPYPESSISKTEKSEINKVTGTNVNEGKPEPGKDAQITRNMQKYPAQKKFFLWQKRIEESVTDSLLLRDRISEFNMLFRRGMGMKMPLSSDGEYVIVFPSGQMADTKNMIRHNFDGDFKALAHCKDLAEKQGAKFLYVCPPAKWMMIPGEGRYSLLHDRNEGNELLYGRFFTRLSDNRIPFINLKKEFWSREIEQSSLFYFSDHHWNLYGAALAAELIADRLNKDCGCSYDLKYVDPACFYKERYKRISVGSQGKKLTKAYMKKMRGEDFEIWYPTWDTSFTVVQQGKTETGPFKILYAAQHLANASYRTNNYAVFHGGDVGNLKIINNNVTVNRKKILFIKNSFALAVVPLLALQTYEIHEIDPRCQSAPSIQQYISDEKPDIVIVFMDIVSLEKNILKHRW